MMMGRGFVHGFGPYGGCGGFLPMIVLLLLVGLVIILIIKHHRKNSAFISQDTIAMDILKTRLAKGEITQEEYEKLKNLIQ